MSSQEARARAIKVTKLMTTVLQLSPDMLASKENAERVAIRLEVFTDRQWAGLARAAGVGLPSATTKEWLVTAVREARV